MSSKTTGEQLLYRSVEVTNWGLARQKGNFNLLFSFRLSFVSYMCGLSVVFQFECHSLRLHMHFEVINQIINGCIGTSVPTSNPNPQIINFRNDVPRFSRVMADSQGVGGVLQVHGSSVGVLRLGGGVVRGYHSVFCAEVLGESTC